MKYPTDVQSFEKIIEGGFTSLFSGANHLKDISFWEDYSAICGITEEELKTVFPVSIRELAAKLRT